MDKGNLIIGAVTLLIFVGIGVVAYTQSQPPAQESEEKGQLVAANGIHRHATLNITVEEEEVPLPANIGIGARGIHSSMHTHAPDNTIHIETSGAVYEADTTIGAFFDIWGREFSESNLLGNTTAEDGGEIVMTVNGSANTELADYQMQNGDVIELRYQDEAAPATATNNTATSATSTE